MGNTRILYSLFTITIHETKIKKIKEATESLNNPESKTFAQGLSILKSSSNGDETNCSTSFFSLEDRIITSERKWYILTTLPTTCSKI